MAAVRIKPKSKRSRFVALDVNDRRTIVAEGTTAKSTITKARRTGKDFSMMFVPAPNQTYIL